MKTSIKCQEFVQNMTNAQMLRIVAQKSKDNKHYQLGAMNIPKTYLSEIEKVANERGLHDDLRKLRNKRRGNNLNLYDKYPLHGVTWLQEKKCRLRDETLRHLNAVFTEMFEFKGSNFKLYCYQNQKFNFTTQKIVDWTSGRKWKPSHTEINVHIPVGYRKNVFNHGLMVLDGLITISAELVHSYANVKVYYSHYVSKGKGYNIVYNRGLIITDGSTHYHYNANHLLSVDDVQHAHIQAAIDEFEAKLQGCDLVKERAKASKGAEREALINKLMTMKQEQVSFELARKAGACHAGIVNWLNQTGLLNADDVPNDFTITLSEFAKAYQKVKRAECLTVFKFWGRANGFKVSDCNATILAKLAK